MMTFECALVLAVMLVAHGPSVEQHRQTDPVKPATFGTSLASYTLNAFDFEAEREGGGIDADANLGRFYTVDSPPLPHPALLAGVQLPNGAAIQGIELQGCDLNPQASLEVVLESWTIVPPNATMHDVHGSTDMGDTTTQAEGCRLWFAPIANVVVESGRSYKLRVNPKSAIAQNVFFQAVRIYYRLRVSPPPAAATFADVPVGSSFHQFVEALFAAGITGGCGGGNYCPNAPITRGQMAVFLAVALGLHWPN